MFERLKRLYTDGKITQEGINNAVAKGWITQEQANEIINPQNEVENNNN